MDCDMGEERDQEQRGMMGLMEFLLDGSQGDSTVHVNQIVHVDQQSGQDHMEDRTPVDAAQSRERRDMEDTDMLRIEDILAECASNIRSLEAERNLQQPKGLGHEDGTGSEPLVDSTDVFPMVDPSLLDMTVYDRPSSIPPTSASSSIGQGMAGSARKDEDKRIDLREALQVLEGAIPSPSSSSTAVSTPESAVPLTPEPPITYPAQPTLKQPDLGSGFNTHPASRKSSPTSPATGGRRTSIETIHSLLASPILRARSLSYPSPTIITVQRDDNLALGPLWTTGMIHDEPQGYFAGDTGMEVDLHMCNMEEEEEVQTRPPRASSFETKLPKEIKVMILQKLMASWACDKGKNGRWVGVEGGRRELVKLTRVSSSWRSLCLDLQLWTDVNLAPLAAALPTETFVAVMKGISPYIRSLSLKGLDDIPPDFIQQFTTFESLSSLDLRGCRSLSEGDIVHILHSSHSLRQLNVKGVQAFNSRIVRMLAGSGLHLEWLDISRCRDITFNDLAEYIRHMSPDQAVSMKTLKIAGSKPYGRTTTDLFNLIATRLTSLSVLDCTGCGVTDEDLRQWAQIHDGGETISPIGHLILSSCQSLTPRALTYLTRRIPNVTKLEIAGMNRMFKDHGEDVHTVSSLLRSVPLLKKLDLDGTGEWGGVGDEVLHVLMGLKVEEVSVGDAKGISSGAFARFVNGCETIRVLGVDNTRAKVSLIRDFALKRRVKGHETVLSMLDCPSITMGVYNFYSVGTRPRAGWGGYEASPFGYTPGDFTRVSLDTASVQRSDGTGLSADEPYDPERGGGEEEVTLDSWQEDCEGKGVLKTMWGWRRVAVGPDWRTMRDRARAGLTELDGVGTGGETNQNPHRGGGTRKRRRSWWSDDEGCVVM